MIKTITSVLSVLVVLLSTAFAGPVTDHGRLYASGSKIVGEKTGANVPVQIKGPSMQWSVSGWGSDRFFIKETVNALVDGWNAQVIRAPLGIDFEKRPDHKVTGGYLSKPEENWDRVKTVVDAAIEKGVYAIVDWHSHTAHETAVTAKAVEFFTSPNLAGRYGNNPAVIFEIYNEPEDDVTWAQVKAYSATVIKAIRDAGFNNLILVGSPLWDWQTDVAAKDPPTDPKNNLAFVCHFYAAEHGINTPFWENTSKTFRAIVQGALDANKPVFVSEWGTNDATEDGKSNFAETDKWHAFLDANKISSCAWGVTASDYNVLDYWTRVGSPLNYDISDLANWTNPGMMTAHGRYIYRWLTGRDTSYSSTIPVLPEFKGPKIPIELSSNKIHRFSNDSSKTSLSVENGIVSLAYRLNKGDYEWDPYAAFGFDIDWLSDCEYGIGYAYRGSFHTVRAEQSDVEDYGFHTNFIPTGDVNEWTEVTVPWGYFRQPEWADIVTQNVSKVNALSWYIEAETGTAGELFVKDAYCLGYKDPSSSVKPNSGASGKNAAPFIKMSGRALQVRMTQNGQVDIFNLKGGKVKIFKLNQGVHALNLNSLPKGIYLIKAKSGIWNRSIKISVN